MLVIVNRNIFLVFDALTILNIFQLCKYKTCKFKYLKGLLSVIFKKYFLTAGKSQPEKIYEISWWCSLAAVSSFSEIGKIGLCVFCTLHTCLFLQNG